MDQQSFFAQMFLELQARITEMVPEIRFVEQDFGQLESPDDMGRYPVSWPCVLIDFPDTKYSDLSNNVQEADDVMINLRLGFPAFSYTSSLQPVHIREQGLKFLEIENRIYQQLHSWAPDELCQPLARRFALTEKREDLLRVRVIGFTTRFEDHNATPAKLRVAKPPLDLDYHQTV